GAALASAIPLAVEVLLILYGGIALFAVLRLTGLHQVLGQGVASLAPDRPRRVLLVALGVAPFLESVIGFGVGMIMAAPILREFGRMASALAQGAARIGGAYVLLAPWIGGLGGFLTGTNTGANAMFAAAQAAAAVELGVPVLGMVAFQNAAASLLTMVSGPRVALARTLVDEGESRQDLVRLPLAADLATLAAWSLWAGLTLRPPL